MKSQIYLGTKEIKFMLISGVFKNFMKKYMFWKKLHMDLKILYQNKFLFCPLELFELP